MKFSLHQLSTWLESIRGPSIELSRPRPDINSSTVRALVEFIFFKNKIKIDFRFSIKVANPNKHILSVIISSEKSRWMFVKLENKNSGKFLKFIFLIPLSLWVYTFNLELSRVKLQNQVVNILENYKVWQATRFLNWYKIVKLILYRVRSSYKKMCKCWRRYNLCINLVQILVRLWNIRFSWS